MTIGYYPGCSLEGTAREYDESVRLTSNALYRDLDYPVSGRLRATGSSGDPADRAVASIAE